MRAVMAAMHHPEKTSLPSILFPIFVKLRRLIGQTKATKKIGYAKNKSCLANELKSKTANYEKPPFYTLHLIASLANCFSPAKAKNRDQ